MKQSPELLHSLVAFITSFGKALYFWPLFMRKSLLSKRVFTIRKTRTNICPVVGMSSSKHSIRIHKYLSIIRQFYTMHNSARRNFFVGRSEVHQWKTCKGVAAWWGFRGRSPPHAGEVFKKFVKINEKFTIL